jgi:hypothetical protein
VRTRVPEPVHCGDGTNNAAREREAATAVRGVTKPRPFSKAASKGGGRERAGGFPLGWNPRAGSDRKENCEAGERVARCYTSPPCCASVVKFLHASRQVEPAGAQCETERATSPWEFPLPPALP